MLFSFINAFILSSKSLAYVGLSLYSFSVWSFTLVSSLISSAVGSYYSSSSKILSSNIRERTSSFLLWSSGKTYLICFRVAPPGIMFMAAKNSRNWKSIGETTISEADEGPII